MRHASQQSAVSNPEGKIEPVDDGPVLDDAAVLECLETYTFHDEGGDPIVGIFYGAVAGLIIWAGLIITAVGILFW